LSAHPETRDITFEPTDNQRLANLCGQCNENISYIEHELGVEISNRGNTFRVIGERHSVKLANILLEQLYTIADNEVLTPAVV